MSAFYRDLRYGLRGLMKQPGVILIAILSLAFGIGANTAIFSVINTVLLKPFLTDAPGDQSRSDQGAA
jgi:putative ABC transport system permease protein